MEKALTPAWSRPSATATFSRMIDVPTRLYFDFIDPLSFLLSLEVEAAQAGGAAPFLWCPLELSPPPSPLCRSDDPAWGDRWSRAFELARGLGVVLDPPLLVPWSRKAHELHAHAVSLGSGETIRRAIFDAFFLSGRDIGRVDVLVDVARSGGLDHSQAKAALDVDRYAETVALGRDSAASDKVTTTPVLVSGHRRLEGFHNRGTVGSFVTRT